jgi:hypothetical protein
VFFVALLFGVSFKHTVQLVELYGNAHMIPVSLLIFELGVKVCILSSLHTVAECIMFCCCSSRSVLDVVIWIVSSYSVQLTRAQLLNFKHV